MYPRDVDDRREPRDGPQPVDPKLFRRLLDRQRQRRQPGVDDDAETRPTGQGATADNPAIARGRGVLNPLPKRRLVPRPSKEQIVGKIRESFDDLNGVLAAIDRKIEQHNQTSAKLESSVRNLPELIEGLPAASKAGAEMLQDLRETLGTQTSLTRDVVQSVEQLALRVAQIPDALARFDDRLDRQEDDQRRAVEALTMLQSSVAQMQADSARLQQETFQQLATTLKSDREETRKALDADRAVIAEVLERGNRQSMVLTVVLVVVVAILAAALLLSR